MFDDKEKIFYQNEDYTVRMEKIDGIERYFLKFNMINSPELEITLDVFMLYYKQFKKPFNNRLNESRRHISNKGSEYHILTNYKVEDEDDVVLKYDIETVLKTCTPTQQKRFNLHYIQNYSLTEIAKMENCDESSVRETIKSVLKKIKKYFY